MVLSLSLSLSLSVPIDHFMPSPSHSVAETIFSIRRKDFSWSALAGGVARKKFVSGPEPPVGCPVYAWCPFSLLFLFQPVDNSAISSR
jgi:hypothetical protein